MSSYLSDTDIVDLARTTLEHHLNRPKFVQIAQRLTDYEVMSRLLKKDNRVIQGGKVIEQRLFLDYKNQAKMTSLYDTDNVEITDSINVIQIPWKRTSVPYSWDRRELLEQKGEKAIVNLFKVREAQALLGLTELCEEQFWQAAAVRDTDKDVYGLQCYIVKNATVGFNGGNPTGFTAGIGGLDATTNTAWRNYAGTYATMNRTDLAAKVATMMRKINFKSPLPGDSGELKIASRYRMYSNEALVSAVELMQENQNDKVGADIPGYYGRAKLVGVPIKYIPYLDDDTANPLYCVNYDTLKCYVQAGDHLRRSDPEKAPGQHNVFRVFIDLTWNVLCIDRRRNGVLYQA